MPYSRWAAIHKALEALAGRWVEVEFTNPEITLKEIHSARESARAFVKRHMEGHKFDHLRPKERTLWLKARKA